MGPLRSKPAIVPYRDRANHQFSLVVMIFSMERRIYFAGKEFAGKDTVVPKMTRDGLTEENLADGSVKDISHKSRGRPPEMKQDFVFDREKKKAELPDGQGGECY